ncbi:MAG: hypothetical protein GY862_33865 [Gammaproteobacteria bacterium]|nr:hypothetical protein [Gammaproteobacteria bacterium]
MIDETVTRLRHDADHQTAIQFLDLIRLSEKTGALQIARINNMLFDDAIAIFLKYDSAVLSFTDCTSFAVCKFSKFRVLAFGVKLAQTTAHDCLHASALVQRFHS